MATVKVQKAGPPDAIHRKVRRKKYYRLELFKTTDD